MTPFPLNLWEGVDTDEDVKVVALQIARNGLSGPIPVDLEYLSILTDLDLGANGLRGPIPQELENLSNLVYLQLNDNQLTVNISAGFLGLVH